MNADSSSKPSPVPEVHTDSSKASPSPVPARTKERTSSQTSEVSVDHPDEKIHKKKKKHKKFKPKLKDREKEEAISLPNSPHGERKKKKSLGLDIDFAKELARAKIHWADVSSQLEEKNMELKQALEREAFVVRELRASRDYVTALEHKVRVLLWPLSSPMFKQIQDIKTYVWHNFSISQLSQVQLERQSCPHCCRGVGLATPTENNKEIIGSSEELQPLDVSTSKAILSQLHTLRRQTEGDSPPGVNGRDLEGSDSSLSTTNQRD